MRKIFATLLGTAMFFGFVTPASAFELPSSFQKYANSKVLANPGILVIDPMSQAEIYASNPDIPRAPASVLKLISSVTAISAFGPDHIFTTSISATNDPYLFFLQGELDPWLTTSSYSSRSFNRGLTPKLMRAIEATGVSLNEVTIKYRGVFEKDIENLWAFYGKKIHFEQVTKSDLTQLSIATELRKINSPMMSDIVGFVLLWSDNTLADRIARISAIELGYSRTSVGMNRAFKEVLTTLEVDSTGLKVEDGSGLSRENLVSTRTIAELLWKIRVEPKFQAIYDGLPISGKTGTLKTRYKKSAKSAAGLVKAKTGWINTSVTLAGYVEVDGNEYIFAILANKVNPTESSRDLARKTIDKMLATIAKPTQDILEV